MNARLDGPPNAQLATTPDAVLKLKRILSGWPMPRETARQLEELLSLIDPPNAQIRTSKQDNGPGANQGRDAAPAAEDVPCEDAIAMVLYVADGGHEHRWPDVWGPAREKFIRAARSVRALFPIPPVKEPR